MRWLQTRLIGPDLSCFSIHSHSYERSKHLSSVLNLPSFRFSPYTPTASSSRIHFLWSRKENEPKETAFPAGGISVSGWLTSCHCMMKLIRALASGALCVGLRST